MNKKLQDELQRATDFGNKAEELVLKQGTCPMGDRNTPLMAYWSLVFEFHKAILALITHEFYGAAFALVRPILEATIRSHLVTFVDDDILKKILADNYRTDFSKVGEQIDTAFGLEGFFNNFLTTARVALHSYTHIGTHQLGRRFSGNDLIPSYSDNEISEVIRSSTSASFMVNNIVTKHFGYEKEWDQNTALYVEWGQHASNGCSAMTNNPS